MTMPRRAAARDAELAARRAQAVRLRTEGKTWPQIAEALGYGSPGAACQDVTRAREAALAEMRESVEVWRVRELARLETLYDTAVEVLGRFHVHVSGGTVVREGVPVVNEETGEAEIADGAGEPLLDDGPALAAIDRLLKISESIRKLQGLDAPQRIETSGSVRFEIDGVDQGDLT